MKKSERLESGIQSGTLCLSLSANVFFVVVDDVFFAMEAETNVKAAFEQTKTFNI